MAEALDDAAVTDKPPYGIIWNKMKSGGVIPFLGAGASMVGRAADARYDPQNPLFLPSGAELSEHLAILSQFPVRDDDPQRKDLAKVASYYVDQGGRDDLTACLRTMLNHQYPAGSLHKFLAELQKPQIIVVTNYDSLLEAAFQQAGHPYDLVVHSTANKAKANVVQLWRHGEAEPTEIEPVHLAGVLEPEERTVIYKMHGSVHQQRADWDSFVITEEDYVEFVSRMATRTAVPPVFYEYFRKRHFLFLGYSLRDWNLRVILRDLSQYFDRGGHANLLSWAVQYRPSRLEGRLWKNRNVNIYNEKLEDFIEQMQQSRRTLG